MANQSGSQLEYDDWKSDQTSDWSDSTIPNRMPYSFGIEIELVANPKTVYDSSNRNEFLNNDIRYWRRRLADRMNKKKGVHAVTSTRPTNYDRWYIMNDNSLRYKPRNYQVALEAVSPKMHDTWTLKRQVNRFWEATNEIFDIESNTSCGAHIHVAPFGRAYKLVELVKVAHAVATQENHVLKILPQERINNDYCRPCSFRSEELKLGLEYSMEYDVEYPSAHVAISLLKMKDATELIHYMQSNSRYVLWNFQNTTSRSGTVEFRGGRHLTGPVRTKRWTAFTVSFISKAIEDDYIFDMSIQSDINEWWQSIRHHAMELDMDEFLPASWTSMRDIVR
ncbi:hypothetical protein V499_00387 [Pseudogymnoascus sp. VKM F-103]|nr:hypothetical protein V499_00387 [Pseudogymnoascus sp. VKM F-103]